MKLTILGASGGVGRELVLQAAASGHQVTALVRSSAPFQAPDAVRVLAGQALDADTLREAIRGSDAVLSAVGQRRAGKSPWGRLLSPPDLMAGVARHLVEVMPVVGVGRLLVVSAGGVRESRSQLTGATRWLVGLGKIAVSYRDLAAMEETLETSTLDWHAVRPVTLVDGPATGRAGPVERYRLTSTIRRADVAAWMLAAVQRPEPFREHVVLLGGQSLSR
jgi:putative NADH-flavin reductase